QQVERRADVDHRLQAEIRHETSDRQKHEQVLLGQQSRETAHYQEGEQTHDNQAHDRAEFFPGDCEHEVRMRIGDSLLYPPDARPAPHEAAIDEGGERLVDLVAVAAGGIEKTIDPAGYVREHEISANETAEAEKPQSDHQPHRQTREEELREPNGRDDHRHAEVGLSHDQPDDDEKQAERNPLPWDSRVPLPFREQPSRHYGECRLYELGRLQREAGDVDPALSSLGLDAGD